VKGFLKGPNARTFVNVVQYLRNFGRFGVNTDDFGRQREDRILVAKEEIPHEIQEASLPAVITCGLGLLKITLRSVCLIWRRLC
jgi:hypothetical protein